MISIDNLTFKRGISICDGSSWRRMPWAKVAEWEKRKPLTFPALDKID
jgi:hypothetical protein